MAKKHKLVQGQSQLSQYFGIQRKPAGGSNAPSASAQQSAAPSRAAGAQGQQQSTAEGPLSMEVEVAPGRGQQRPQQPQAEQPRAASSSLRVDADKSKRILLLPDDKLHG